MDIFVARQPILDRNNKIFGFELLFRSSEKNYYNNIDGDKATIEVINNSFVNIGIEKIIGEKKAFINFTENILKSNITDIISNQLVVIEILENVEPTDEIISICRVLKNKGFIIALDDFVFDEKYRKLLEFADIIKVDFTLTKGDDRRRIIQKVGNKNIKFLAEKVETIEEFNQASRLGYSYFQGYYFAKPYIFSRKDIPQNKIAHLKILGELNREEISLQTLVDLIKKDVSLSFKLLKLINSSAFGFINKINSLSQAVALIGEVEVIKWIYFIVVNSIGDDKPEIITINSLTRARFGELIAEKLGQKDKSFNSYLAGMLSMMDAILDRPLESILKELYLPLEVNEALVDKKDNIYSKILQLTISYEEGNWNKVSSISNNLGLDESFLPYAYTDAIQWSKEM